MKYDVNQTNEFFCHNIECSFILWAVTNASFDQSSYNGRENGFVEVCVVLEGQIQREVIVSFFQLNGSATGKYLTFFMGGIRYCKFFLF